MQQVRWPRHWKIWRRKIPTNEKLVARSYGIVSEITGCSLDEAKIKIEKFGSIKKALVAYFTDCEDLILIDEVLESVKGNIRNAIKKIKGEQKWK